MAQRTGGLSVGKPGRDGPSLAQRQLNTIAIHERKDPKFVDQKALFVGAATLVLKAPCPCARMAWIHQPDV